MTHLLAPLSLIEQILFGFDRAMAVKVMIHAPVSLFFDSFCYSFGRCLMVVFTSLPLLFLIDLTDPSVNRSVIGS